MYLVNGNEEQASPRRGGYLGEDGEETHHDDGEDEKEEHEDADDEEIESNEECTEDVESGKEEEIEAGLRNSLDQSGRRTVSRRA